MRDFKKSICGDFDRIDIEASQKSEWLTLTMRVGNDVDRVMMTIRSTEAVRDLHYAIGRYLETIKEKVDDR